MPLLSYLQRGLTVCCLHRYGPCEKADLKNRMKRAVALLGPQEIAGILQEQGKIEVGLIMHHIARFTTFTTASFLKAYLANLCSCQLNLGSSISASLCLHCTVLGLTVFGFHNPLCIQSLACTVLGLYSLHH